MAEAIGLFVRQLIELAIFINLREIEELLIPKNLLHRHLTYLNGKYDPNNPT